MATYRLSTRAAAAALFVCAALALAGCSKKTETAKAPAEGGSAGTGTAASAEPAAPDFRLQTTAGDSLQFSSLRGKVVLVDFWATWCPPCKAEIPHLVDLYRKYGSKGLMVVGVAADPSERDQVAPFVKSHDIPYPVVYGGKDLEDAYGGLQGYPTVFLIDKQGRIVQKFIGLTEESVFEQSFQQLL